MRFDWFSPRHVTCVHEPSSGVAPLVTAFSVIRAYGGRGATRPPRVMRGHETPDSCGPADSAFGSLTRTLRDRQVCGGGRGGIQDYEALASTTLEIPDVRRTYTCRLPNRVMTFGG